MKDFFNKSVALFRVPLRKGRYLAVFWDMLVLEYYDKDSSDMEFAKRLL